MEQSGPQKNECATHGWAGLIAGGVEVAGQERCHRLLGPLAVRL
jgi:hypothetical protein